MAAPLLVFFLVAACSAELGFKPKQQYEYLYEVKQGGGIPGLADQWSVLALRSHLTVQVPSQGALYLQMKDVHYGELQNQFVNQVWRKRLPVTWQPIPSFKKELETPFKVVLEQGVFQKIVCSRDEPTWIVNLKKGVAQLLQLNLNENQATSTQYGSLTSSPYSRQSDYQLRSDIDSSSRFFRVMEQGIGGICESIYESTPKLNDAQKFDIIEDLRVWDAQVKVPELKEFQPFLVLKTKNYQNCVERPIWRHLTPPATNCRSDDCHLTASNRSSAVRYILDGDQSDFCIQSVTAESESLVYPYGHEVEQLWTVTNQTMVLAEKKRMGPFMGDPPNPSEDTKLRFRYPTQTGQEVHMPDLSSAPQISPYMPGIPIREVMKQLSLSQLSQRVVELLQKMDTYMQHVPEPVSQDVAAMTLEVERALSLCSAQTIQQIYQRLQNDAQKELLFDILGVVGTNPAIYQLQQYILSGEVKQEWRAASSVATWPMYVKTPTPGLVAEMLKMLKSSKVQQSPQLRMTIPLSISNIFYQVCVSNVTRDISYPTSIYGQFCNSEMFDKLTNEFLPFLVNKVQQTQVPEKYAYIQAIGNIGHEIILPHLTPLMRREQSKVINAKAIYALYRLNAKIPGKIQQLVSPIFHDITRDPEVRQAALTALIATNPPIAYWQKVAVSTWFEPSEQVVSFVHTAIDSLANNTMAEVQPFFEMSRRARIVLPLIRPRSPGYMYSHKVYTASTISKYQVGVINMFSMLSTPTDTLPTTIYSQFWYYINSFVDSHWKAVVDLHGVQSIIDEYLSDNVRQSPRDLSSWSTKAEPLQSSLYVQFFGAIDRFATLDRQQYEDIKRKHREGGSATSLRLNRLIYMVDKVATFPSEIGLPVVYTRKLPTIMSVRGQMKVQWSQDAYEITLDQVQPFVFTKDRTMVSTVSPWSLNWLGVGVDNSAMIALPMSLRAHLDKNAKKLSISGQMLDQPSKVPVLHIKTVPFTTAIKATQFEQLTTSGQTKQIISGPRTVAEVPFGEPLGIKGTVKLSSEYAIMNFGTLFNQFKKMESNVNRVSFWYLMDSLRARHYNVTVDVASSLSRKFEATFTVTYPGENNYATYQPTVESGKHYSTVATTHAKAQQMMLRSELKGRQTSVTGTATITQSNSHQLQYNGVLSFSTDAGHFAHHVQFNGETPKHKICLETKSQVPALSENRQRLLSEPVRGSIGGSLKFGQASCDENVIHMTGKIERDETGRQYATSCPEALRCMKHEESENPTSADCHIAKHHAATINFVGMDFTFGNLPIGFRNASYSLDYLSKYLFWPYSSHNPYQQNPNGKLQVNVRLNPYNNSISAHVIKPFETSKYEHIPLPFYYLRHPYPLSVREYLGKTIADIVYGMDKTVCTVDNRILKTFDNATVETQLSNNCFTLLAEDRTGIKDVSILLKKSKTDKVVRIIADSKKVDISVSYHDYKVDIDGQQQPIRRGDEKVVKSQDNRELIRLSLVRDDLMWVTMNRHSIWMRITRPSVMLNMSPLIYRNKVTGVCGNLNGEHTHELVDQNGCKVIRPDDFVKSYRRPASGQQSECAPVNVDPSKCVKRPSAIRL